MFGDRTWGCGQARTVTEGTRNSTQHVQFVLNPYKQGQEEGGPGFFAYLSGVHSLLCSVPEPCLDSTPTNW